MSRVYGTSRGIDLVSHSASEKILSVPQFLLDGSAHDLALGTRPIVCDTIEVHHSLLRRLDAQIQHFAVITDSRSDVLICVRETVPDLSHHDHPHVFILDIPCRFYLPFFNEFVNVRLKAGNETPFLIGSDIQMALALLRVPVHKSADCLHAFEALRRLVEQSGLIVEDP